MKAGFIRHTVNKITFSEQCYYIFGDIYGSKCTFVNWNVFLDIDVLIGAFWYIPVGIRNWLTMVFGIKVDQVQVRGSNNNSVG